MEGNRHIYLSSQACTDTCPYNTPYDFTNILSESLDLRDGTHEMALEEIHFVSSLANLSDVEYQYTDAVDGSKPQGVILNNQTPDSIKAFIKTLNGSLPDVAKTKIKFTFDPVTLKVSVTLAQDWKLKIPSSWSKILGFDTDDIQQSMEGKYAADMFTGLHMGYVMCDLSQLVPVGDKLLPVLGTIELYPEDMGILVSKIITTPEYSKISPGIIQNVRIYITDIQGQPLHLRLHPTTVKLSFRKRYVA